jgi:hypothetical protein
MSLRDYLFSKYPSGKMNRTECMNEILEKKVPIDIANPMAKSISIYKVAQWIEQN